MKSKFIRLSLCALFAFSALAMLSCSHKEKEAAPVQVQDNPDHKAVQKVVQKSYDNLLEGNIEEYLASVHDCDSMNETYHKQMVDLMTQFVEEENEKEGGLKKAEVVGDSLLTSEEAMAFVQLTYASDSTELIEVPVVKVDKKWMLR